LTSEKGGSAIIGDSLNGLAQNARKRPKRRGRAEKTVRSGGILDGGKKKLDLGW